MAIDVSSAQHDLHLPIRDAARLPAELQWKLAGFYRVKGAFEAAAELLDEIESARGETGRLIDERARLAAAMGRTEDAAAILDARALRSTAATTKVALARHFLESGRIYTASVISDALSRDHPELMTVSALAADVARATGDFASARTYHERVLEERPDSVAAMLALAGIALDEMDVLEAPGLLDHALMVAGEAATAPQLTEAAAIAERLDQGARAELLRERAARLNEAQAASLRSAIGEALGWPSDDNGEVEPLVDLTATALQPPRPEVEAEAADQFASDDADEDALPAIPAIGEAPVLEEIDPRALETLRRDFGHEALRPGQAAVIANVLAGRDTLATMPTGAGKSLTFQLPAMLLDGVTLVISPLIALMKDQVESLPPVVQARTALINSTLTPEEMRSRLDDLAAGALKLVYVAPERLRHHAFLRALRSSHPALVVIDEAHCISLWGYDFRPDYLFIPKALPELGDPPVLAITATATPAMARAIATGLGRPLERVRVSLFRSNLFYEVHQVANREAKVAKAVEICRQERGAGIVYVSSRRDAENIAAILRDRGVGAIPYHAGLEPDLRARNQDRFMAGNVRVVVATVAFGMGVDKADVRFIVHLNPPRSLEAYAQESGRAGRDGQPARCVLLTAAADQGQLNRMARRDELDIDTLRRVYAGIKRVAVGRWAIADPSRLLPPATDGDPDDDVDPRVALGILEEARLVHRHPDAPIRYELRWQRRLDLAADQAALDADAATWARFRQWWAENASDEGESTVGTAHASEALGLTPVELDRLFSQRPEVSAFERNRTVCLELLPVQGDATARLLAILERARAEARRRIAQVMAYASTGKCRHVVLAAHLGEALAPCETSCDVCRDRAARRDGREVVTAEREASPGATQRTQITAADALAVLEAVSALRFPMGKTGLVRLLVGSVESRVRADRSPAFGKLAGMTRGKVEGLIGRLVTDGFLQEGDPIPIAQPRAGGPREYLPIVITPEGAEATVADLAAYEPVPTLARAAAAPTADPADLPVDEALLERLKTWRRQRAVKDGLSPAYVAHDQTLRDLAAARPASKAALGHVYGLGSRKIDRYGDELLALIADPEE